LSKVFGLRLSSCSVALELAIDASLWVVCLE
jgi:hypothetical protein